VSRRLTVKRRPKWPFGVWLGWADMPLTWRSVEPMTGIEPAYSAWEADVLPLNYIGNPGQAGENEG
jgi:hypothetical protein